MGMMIPVTAALLAAAFSLADATWSATAGIGRSDSPAIRFEGGDSATFTVSARIVRAAAGVGPQRGPPLPRMIPRRATVTAADGRTVPAVIYDFE